MAVDITCIRGAGDQPGPDIAEPILSDAAAAVARGRTEIDAREPYTIRSVTIPYQVGLRRGMTARVIDPEYGAPYHGVVESVSITTDIDGATMTVRLRVPESQQ